MRLPRRPPDRAPLQARRRLRSGVVQLLCAAGGVVAGLALPSSGVGPFVDGGRLTEPLVTLGVGVVGVVSIVYSLLFGVVQWSAGTFSPRLALFRDDPMVWRTFAFAIGVFVYCTVAAVAGADQHRVSVLVPGAAILGVLVAVGLIRRLQLRAFASIQLAYVLKAIGAQGRRVIDHLYPPRSGAVTGAPSRDAPAGRPHGEGTPGPTPADHAVVWTGRSGVVQQLDLPRLVVAASQADAVVSMTVAVGDTVHEGAPLATVDGSGPPDDVVRRAVVRGTERSFDQDPLLAFRLLADIALRALSPAVNDPASAVDALDATDGLLRHLITRDLDVAEVRDDRGVVRVRLVVPTWEDVVRTGVADLLPVAAASPMVLRRMVRLLDHLLGVAPPAARDALVPIRDDVRSELAEPSRRGAGWTRRH
ncbi:DUF2254 family protein [Krasilnikoviella flava]|uniref:Uncharacterized membrane protein n=1 Tax=Krasilnikoviella flava TaxID=526729 RepID=A0A1T5IDY6_9MICO|nr:DUF2254 family protein [Krasilnikoviella flava]SKC37233.1 Uncharacterized membrane protein [Krasilnikoviella flava]